MFHLIHEYVSLQLNHKPRNSFRGSLAPEQRKRRSKEPGPATKDARLAPVPPPRELYTRRRGEPQAPREEAASGCGTDVGSKQEATGAARGTAAPAPRPPPAPAH